MLELTKEQESAAKSLERALKKCHDSHMFIHNCYGTLYAYNGENVKVVNNDISKHPCYEGRIVNSKYNLDSFADDEHFVHFKT